MTDIITIWQRIETWLGHNAPVEPCAIQAISGASAAGTGMRVGTDVGLWLFE